MSKKILVLLGHPDRSSFCGALASAYVAGARAAGASVRRLNLGTLKFDPILHEGYRTVQQLEPDLLRAQRYIRWADHLVFVYPMWWGGPPAILKGFIDRTFHPGFAFKFHGSDSYLWDKLLLGKSARLIITTDGPPAAIRLLYGDPAVQSMKSMTLEFCGIRPVRVSIVGSVKRATRARLALWKLRAQDLGAAES